MEGESGGEKGRREKREEKVEEGSGCQDYIIEQANKNTMTDATKPH